MGALLDGSGLTYRYFPSYSPGPRPDRAAWAKVKAGLRKTAARAVDRYMDGLYAALGPALDAITAQDAQSFFRRAGYACPN